jgi:hypothetical protein
MTFGPLQVLVVNFDEANFAGQIQAELRRLEETGIVRTRKGLVIAKTGDGDIQVLRVGGEDPGELSADERDVADSLEPGAAAAIAVLEHQWAVRLREAIVSAGGTEVRSDWVDAEQLAGLGITLPS